MGCFFAFAGFGDGSPPFVVPHIPSGTSFGIVGAPLFGLRVCSGIVLDIVRNANEDLPVPPLLPPVSSGIVSRTSVDIVVVAYTPTPLDILVGIARISYGDSPLLPPVSSHNVSGTFSDILVVASPPTPLGTLVGIARISFGDSLLLPLISSRIVSGTCVDIVVAASLPAPPSIPVGIVRIAYEESQDIWQSTLKMTLLLSKTQRREKQRKGTEGVLRAKQGT